MVWITRELTLVLSYFTENSGSQTSSSLPHISMYVHMSVALGLALDMKKVIQS